MSGVQAKIRFRPDWVALALLAFGLRLAAAFAMDAFRHPQVYEYEGLARAIVAGHGFVYEHLGIVYHSFAPPLYAWLCAAIYLVGGGVGTVLVVQMVASSGQAVLVTALAERLSGRRSAGIAAGLLVAVHPGLIVYASLKTHPLTFDALFFTLVFWLFWRLRDWPSVQRATATGLVIGLGALSRATTVIFLPMGGFWLLAASARDQWLKLASRCVLVALCAAAVLAPWAVRNTIIHNEFVWMLTVDSEAFWRGNNSYATGHSYIDADHIVLDTLTPSERADLYSQPNELAQSRWFRTRAWSFIEANPGAFVRLTAQKFFHFWWFSAQSGVEYPRWWLHAYQAYYVGVLALAVVGLWTIMVGGDPDSRRAAWLLLGFLIVLSGLESLYYVEGRHRWAVEPLMLILSSTGASVLLGRWRRKR